MARLVDVAKLAGVSPSMVSHALSGKRRISQEAKARILRAIAELGYEPDPNAQALRGARSPIIGFIAANITDLFLTHIIQGTERVTREHNAFLLFASGAEFDNNLKDAVSFLRRRQVDGLIISYAISRTSDIELLRKLELPIVTVNTRIPHEIPSVMPDNREGGLRAAEHLLAQGSRCPAMIAGPRDRIASQEREEGFLAALREAGMGYTRAQTVFDGDFTPASGAAGLRELLRLNPAVDGIFCANDFMAAGAMTMAVRLGLAVPDRMRILGFDNRDFTAFWPIPISTFAQPLDDMGQISAELLFELIGGAPRESRDIKLKSTLIQRQST